MLVSWGRIWDFIFKGYNISWTNEQSIQRKWLGCPSSLFQRKFLVHKLSPCTDFLDSGSYELRKHLFSCWLSWVLCFDQVKARHSELQNTQSTRRYWHFTHWWCMQVWCCTQCNAPADKKNWHRTTNCEEIKQFQNPLKLQMISTKFI